MSDVTSEKTNILGEGNGFEKKARSLRLVDLATKFVGKSVERAEKKNGTIESLLKSSEWFNKEKTQ